MDSSIVQAISSATSALIGAGAALAGSHFQTKGQRDNQHEQRMWNLRQETYTAFLAATAAVRDEVGRTLRIMAGVVPPLPAEPDEQDRQKLVSRLAEQSALAGSAIQASAASVRSMNGAQARVLIAGPPDAIRESQAAMQAARDVCNVLLKQYDAGVFQGLEEPVAFRDALSRLRVGEESFAAWSQSVLGTRPVSLSRVRWWRK